MEVPTKPERHSTHRPYNLFTKVNRPTLPTDLKNAEREKLLGLMWQALSTEGKAAYHGRERPRPAPQATREVPRQGVFRKQGTTRRTSYGWFEGPTKTKWTGGEWFTQAERWARAKQAAVDDAPKVLVPPAKRRAAAEGVAVWI